MEWNPQRDPPEEEGGHETGSRRMTRIVLADSHREARRVRDCVRSLLLGRAEHCVTDVLLVADELVCDAMEFGGAPREVWLKITYGGSRFIIEARSADVASVGGPQRQVTGIGRMLLEQLTADWGVHRQAGSKTTWAAVNLTGDAAFA